MKRNLLYLIDGQLSLATLEAIIRAEQKHRQPVLEFTGMGGYRQPEVLIAPEVTVAPEVPRWKPQHFKRTGSKFF